MDETPEAKDRTAYETWVADLAADEVFLAGVTDLAARVERGEIVDSGESLEDRIARLRERRNP